MRLAGWMLLLVAVLPTVGAQSGSSLHLAMQPSGNSPDNPLRAGTSLNLTFDLVRSCGPNPYLPEITVTFAPITADKAGLSLSGPASLVMPQQVCATEPQHKQGFNVEARAMEHVATAEAVVVIKFHVEPIMPTQIPETAEGSFTFVLHVVAAEMPAPDVDDSTGPTRASPFAPLVLQAVVILAAVASLKRSLAWIRSPSA